MKITKELITEILKKTQDPNEVSKLLIHYEDIYKSLGKLDKEKAELETSYELALYEIDDQIRKIRQSCGHPLKTFYGDPAGGSDSFHQCEICGKEF